jgi:hypothetical protein
MWQLDPVEVRPRTVPPVPGQVLEAPEASVFADEGVDPALFREYLRQNSLALAVSRNVTTRDKADRQQPFNLRVPGGAQALGRRESTTCACSSTRPTRSAVWAAPEPSSGRRVLAQVMHAPEVRTAEPHRASGSVLIGLDGSMASLVPARRAMAWHLTDPAGVPVVRERYWLSFQPGEIRTCASCHGLNSKDQANAPKPTNPPEALRDFLRFWKANLFVAASVDDVSVVEGGPGNGGSALFHVLLSRPPNQAVTVGYSTANMTAVAGTDYQAVSGTLTFAPGAQSRTVSVPVIGDGGDEGNKTFALNLGSAVNAVVSDGQGIATILDDDGPAVSVNDTTVTEGSAGTTNVSFQVSLAAPPAVATTVGYATADLSAAAGSDYVAASGTLTFAPGVSTLSVPVAVIGDTQDEPDEQFALVLSGASNPIADGDGRATILDDDGGTVSPALGLSHGDVRVRSLAALPVPAAEAHWYVVKQDPASSYEAVVDAASGDVQPLSLRRLSAAGTQVQAATGSGVGQSRSLRWANTSTAAVSGESVVVSSGGCGTGCGADDGYRIRFYDTTGLLARFNNAGSQSSVLILHNSGTAPVSGRAFFWSAQGTLLASVPVALPPHGSQTVLTNQVAGLVGQSGTITVAHDAPYGVLTGKAVALEPSTGLSFDTPLLVRPR